MGAQINNGGRDVKMEDVESFHQATNKSSRAVAFK